jgi:2-methylcitrate dehydratase PrpD
MSNTRDLVHDFADFAASVRYEDVPPDAREAAKKSILDTLGVALAASGLEPAARAVADIVREAGGAPQATLLGWGGKAPAVMAAFSNGALSHCLDYDDMTPWGQHATTSIVPAVFALAERRGGVSGQDMIAAVAAGQDLFARLRRFVEWKKDWNLSTVAGVFAGTAAAGRVMGMEPALIAAALGIATMQSAGVMEMVSGQGSDLRGLYAGFSSKGVVLAALMAEKGISGIDRAFEGPHGILNTYFGGRYDRAAILDGLGRDFQGAGTLYKRWPAVGTSHCHIKAMIDVVTTHDLAPEDIMEIRLHIGDFHALMCQPLAQRRAPATLTDAKFSLPFLVAVAAVRRALGVRDFSAAGLCDAEVLAMARKVTLVPDPSLDWGMELPPGRLEVIASNGRNWLVEGRNVPGSPENPMSWDDVCAKFCECTSVCAMDLGEIKVARAVDMGHRLDSLVDATDLIRCLA